jgi:tripartite-type tricarboxylate transporter receptor subunit TctC
MIANLGLVKPHLATLGTLGTLALLSIAALAAAAPAAAQYPERPLKIIVPTPAGGPSDTAARVIARELAKPLGQPVVVENKPGALGAIAAQAVLAAPPDGYTLLWGVSSMPAIPLLQKSAPYQSMAEFTPVSIVGPMAFGLFVNPAVPAKTVGELVQHLRANPDKLSFAAGPMSEWAATAQFMKASGTQMQRVPYQGNAQALPDLIGGRVQVYFTALSTTLPHTKDGRVRLLATLTRERTALTPEVPTMAEGGFAQLTHSSLVAQTLFLPPKTPRDIAERLAREVAAVLRHPEVRPEFDRQALTPTPSTPDELAAAMAEATEAWRTFIRENNIAMQ